MNVRELIEELTKVDGDLKVQIEGCDCINPAKGVHVGEFFNYVLIEAHL